MTTFKEMPEIANDINASGSPEVIDNKLARLVLERQRTKVIQITNNPFLVKHPATGVMNRGEFVGSEVSSDGALSILAKVQSLGGTTTIPVPLENIRQFTPAEKVVPKG